MRIIYTLFTAIFVCRQALSIEPSILDIMRPPSKINEIISLFRAIGAENLKCISEKSNLDVCSLLSKFELENIPVY